MKGKLGQKGGRMKVEGRREERSEGFGGFKKAALRDSQCYSLCCCPGVIHGVFPRLHSAYVQWK